MPSSRACTVPYVVTLITSLKPKSILDVGVGFGKWGYLFREYTDICQSEHDATRYRKEGWQTIIEGIEAYEPYLCAAHEYIYNRIHKGNAANILPTLEQYDVVFFGDVIEHFEIDQGKDLLRTALQHANKCVLVTTPRFETGQGELCQNPLEKHRSLWTPTEFNEVGDCKISLADRSTYFVAYWQPGTSPVDAEWIIDIKAGLHRNLKRAVRSILHAFRPR